jgi:hypothetical protein
MALNMKISTVYASAAVGILSLSSATLAGISDPFLVINASNNSGSGSFIVPLADTTPSGGGRTYSLLMPVDIMDGPNVIATITQLNSSVSPASGTNPNRISLSFTFFAGCVDGAGSTHFTVDSALFNIAPLMAGTDAGRATAGYSITDSDNDGVTLQGSNPLGGAFSARYNGNAPGQGTNFAELIAGPRTAGPGQTASGTSTTPPGAGQFGPIGTHVNNMTSRWDFSLTPCDQVGVTSAWFIVPSPGALSLIGLAGLSFARRNRR